jgi:hypothetical protein
MLAPTTTAVPPIRRGLSLVVLSMVLPFSVFGVTPA